MLEQGRVGEQERAAREAAQNATMFAEYAKRRQMDQDDKRIAQTGDIASERLASASALQDAKNKNAELLAQMNIGGRKDVAGMQHGPQGSVDRTNTSREGIADRGNQAAETRVRISVDGANRRDNNIVILPDGSYGVSDATGRVSPLNGTPYNNPSGSQGKTAKGKQLTAGERQKLIQADRASGQLRSDLDVLDEADREGVSYAGAIDANALRLKNFLQQSDPQTMKAQRAAAAWSRLSSKETNALFGAALSGREDARIQHYLPRLSSTNEKVVAEAVRGIKQVLDEARNRQLEIYEADGYDVDAYKPKAPSGPPRPPSGAAPGATPWTSKKQ